MGKSLKALINNILMCHSQTSGQAVLRLLQFAEQLSPGQDEVLVYIRTLSVCFLSFGKRMSKQEKNVLFFFFLGCRSFILESLCSKLFHNARHTQVGIDKCR